MSIPESIAPRLRISLHEFQEILNANIGQLVSSSFPLEWKEDYLSLSIAKYLRDYFRNVTIHGFRIPLHIDWEVYKLSGASEQRHGDIGVVVCYRLPNGSVITGAGFLEAKLRSRDSNRFDQVRTDQTDRLLRQSPMTQLLLYDFQPVIVLDQIFLREFYFQDFSPNPCRGALIPVATNTPVIPLQIAKAVDRYDHNLYPFCYSLSYQFAHRFFQLHDLDFSSDAIAAVKGVPGGYDFPNIVMVLRVASSGMEPPGSSDFAVSSEFEPLK